jgi:cutinase
MCSYYTPPVPKRSRIGGLITRLLRRIVILAVLLIMLPVVTTMVSERLVFASRAKADDSCPDIHVVFARGTGELPGVGVTGQSFIDALQARMEGTTVTVYPVDFPAVPYFPDSAVGVADTRDHVRFISDTCPDTRIILGGFSRGAELIGLTTFGTASRWVDPSLDITPIPPELAGHVHAVVMLGRPAGRFLSEIGAPPVTTVPLYADKTLDLCANGDPVCSNGWDEEIHRSYPMNGMTDQAAEFAARMITIRSELDTVPPQ